MDTTDPRLDCGHRADRPRVTYCNDCIERICRERDAAQLRVRQLEQDLALLASDYRALIARAGR